MVIHSYPEVWLCCCKLLKIL